jgi:hypothetical protein
MINNPQPDKIKVKHDPSQLMEEEDLFKEPTQPVADTDGAVAPVLVIRWVNDEQVDILLYGEELISVNHDEHGWDGIQVALNLSRTFARKLGAEVRTEGDPNL